MFTPSKDYRHNRYTVINPKFLGLSIVKPIVYSVLKFLEATTNVDCGMK